MSQSPRPVTIAPSLLAADFARLGDEARAVEAAGADWLHLDVMDGHFVPNISFGPIVLAALRPLTKLPFDVHLMIEPVDPFIRAFAEAGADHLIIHAEAGPHLHRSLQLIRSLGKRAGVALNPATPPEAAAWVLDLVDIMLVMTVNPGFGGQSFLASQLPKIAALRHMIDAGGPADRAHGRRRGRHRAPPARSVAAGADTLVAGTAVFRATDYRQAIAGLRCRPRDAIAVNRNGWLRDARRAMAKLPSLRDRPRPRCAGAAGARSVAGRPGARR